ncbi:hypothetical protein K474DRAFT_1712930 [Panus rudis PR-1116 ss-1]|nr:hypothetical protein K474DRAFT_1712930 [Panus rudis PR-1116 ss-1]
MFPKASLVAFVALAAASNSVLALPAGGIFARQDVDSIFVRDDIPAEIYKGRQIGAVTIPSTVPLKPGSLRKATRIPAPTYLAPLPINDDAAHDKRDEQPDLLATATHNSPADPVNPPQPTFSLHDIPRPSLLMKSTGSGVNKREELFKRIIARMFEDDVSGAFALADVGPQPESSTTANPTPTGSSTPPPNVPPWMLGWVPDVHLVPNPTATNTPTSTQTSTQQGFQGFGQGGPQLDQSSSSKTAVEDSNDSGALQVTTPLDDWLVPSSPSSSSVIVPTPPSDPTPTSTTASTPTHTIPPLPGWGPHMENGHWVHIAAPGMLVPPVPRA